MWVDGSVLEGNQAPDAAQQRVGRTKERRTGDPGSACPHAVRERDLRLVYSA